MLLLLLLLLLLRWLATQVTMRSGCADLTRLGAEQANHAATSTASAVPELYFLSTTHTCGDASVTILGARSVPKVLQGLVWPLWIQKHVAIHHTPLQTPSSSTAAAEDTHERQDQCIMAAAASYGSVLGVVSRQVDAL
jgi:hypothetical protein